VSRLVGQWVCAWLIISAGVLALRHAHLITGGTTGLALSAAYWTGLPFSAWFVAVNLPFYLFSLRHMGWRFTVSTLLSVTAVSTLTAVDTVLPPFALPPAVGAVAGGLLIGWGLVRLFASGSSLGGANILALYLHRRFGWDPGTVTFAFDAVVILTGTVQVGVWNGLWSVVSIYILAKIISRQKNRIATQPASPHSTAA